MRQQGDRHREAALHNNLADLLHAQGRDGEAMTHLEADAAPPPGRVTGLRAVLGRAERLSCRR